MSNTRIAVATGNLVVSSVPSSGITPQYPSEYFANNNHSKPGINLPMSGGTLVQIRNKMYADIKNGSMTVELAKAYVALVMQSETIKTEAVWTSFGVTIAALGAEISPLSLVTVSDSSLTQTWQIPEDVPALNDSWMLLAALAPLRVARIAYTAYNDAVSARIEQQMSAHGMPSSINPNIANYSSLYKEWENDTNYKKLGSIIDMFYSNFRESRYSYVRVCTLGSRYRDCAVLTALGYISKVIGATLEDFSEWFFYSALALEYEAIMKTGEEIDKADSYMPYLTDLALSNRSPYSATMNPNLHTLIHILGTTMGNERSYNAHFLSNVNVPGVLANGELVSYRYRVFVNLNVQFVENEEALQAANRLRDASSQTSSQIGQHSLEDHKPLSYMIMYSDAGGKVPQEIVDYCRNRWASITVELRDKTIGKWLHDMSLGNTET